jgi:site-specific DNA-methyltransferase (adenine-specific)
MASGTTKKQHLITETQNVAIGNIETDRIICGDVIKELKKLPDKSVDLVLADPPYNLSQGASINFNNQGLKGFGGEWNKVMEEWDNLPLKIDERVDR